MAYDYRRAITDDIKDYLKDNLENYEYTTRDELEEQLNDDLWVEDSITGNGSGSYTCNSAKSREYLQGNENLLVETMKEFDGDWERALTDPEYSDVSIRCYLLGECIGMALDELEEAGDLTYSEEED